MEVAEAVLWFFVGVVVGGGIIFFTIPRSEYCSVCKHFRFTKKEK